MVLWFPALGDHHHLFDFLGITSSRRKSPAMQELRARTPTGAIVAESKMC
jgi:hypothetical protein